jgi:hypothetical protein
MTQKRSSFDKLSALTARQAQTEAAILQRDLKKLRDSLSNANRSIREPVIRAKRTKTRATTNTSVWDIIAAFGITALSGEGLLGDSPVQSSTSLRFAGGSFSYSSRTEGDAYSDDSFYPSSAQSSNTVLKFAFNAQRIR